MNHWELLTASGEHPPQHPSIGAATLGLNVNDLAPAWLDGILFLLLSRRSS